MKVKSRGTLIDNSMEPIFTIDKGEVKELPPNWRERPGIKNHLQGKNPMLKFDEFTPEQEFINKDVESQKDDGSLIVPSKRKSEAKKAEEKKAAEKEAEKNNVDGKSTIPEHMIDNYLAQNSNAVIKAIEEDSGKLTKQDFANLLNFEKDNKKRPELISFLQGKLR